MQSLILSLDKQLELVTNICRSSSFWTKTVCHSVLHRIPVFIVFCFSFVILGSYQTAVEATLIFVKQLLYIIFLCHDRILHRFSNDEH